jgi:sulfur transfer complex TusBCD TusB component (DsrH family)
MKCKNCGKIFNESKQFEIYGHNKNEWCRKSLTTGMCQDCITKCLRDNKPCDKIDKDCGLCTRLKNDSEVKDNAK